jgi:RNA 3'-phosphate cyclase
MIEIDGSLGEGGGQVIRTAVSLAAVLKKDLFIKNIRAGRPKPGLQAQHLTAVSAAALLSDAKFTGEFGSTSLTFTHERNKQNDDKKMESSVIYSPLGKRYDFDIGSAGATTLVLQTVLPILLCAPFLGDSPLHTTISVTGGTAASFAPPAIFFSESFLPHVNEMLRLQHERNTSLPRIKVSTVIEKHGLFPLGGGRITMTVTHSHQPIHQTAEGLLPPLHAVTLLAPNSLISREIFKALPVLHSKSPKSPPHFTMSSSPSKEVTHESLHGLASSFSLLERGKLVKVSSECMTMNLPIGQETNVANIQAKILDQTLSTINGVATHLEPSTCLSVQGSGKGNVVFIKAVYENVCSIFSGFSSERGKKDDLFERGASKVSDEALKAAIPYLSCNNSAAPVHHFLADQLLLPLALLGGGQYRYLPDESDKHFATNRSVLEIFLGKIVSLKSVESGVTVDVLMHQSHQLMTPTSFDESSATSSESHIVPLEITSPVSSDVASSVNIIHSPEEGLKRKRMGIRRRKKLMKKNAALALLKADVPAASTTQDGDDKSEGEDTET